MASRKGKPAPLSKQTSDNAYAADTPRSPQGGVDDAEPHFNEFTSIQVCNDGDGGFDFFVNLDNTYLLTELTRTKEAEGRSSSSGSSTV